jgi:DNA repair photolyase
VFVFWSKHPSPLIPFLNEIEASGYRFYFQYTLNDYEQEGLEPCLPKLSQRLVTFKNLAERIGKHRVIWRFDPIIMSNTLTVERVLNKIQIIAREVANYTEKLVFSYVNWYKKTEKTLKQIDASLRPPTQDEMWQLAMGITAINAQLQSPLQLATCAETIDLAAFGMAKNKCVDDKLILGLYPDEPEILNLYGRKGTQATLVPLIETMAKDTGQRTPCGCVPSKDIGSYNTCMHLCTYCYANQSPKTVISRMNTLNTMSEKL